MGRRALLTLAFVAGAVLAPRPAPAPAMDIAMPGPARSPRRADAAAENARCEGCHTAIAAEWRASLHSRAHTHPAYQRALSIEPLPFCRGCHAPEADPTQDPPPALGALGVGCVTCHVTTTGVLAAPAPARGPAAAPHPVARAAAFATAAACASCHEFSFPDPERRDELALMQSTATEHRGSPFAAVSCAGCHMPLAPEPGGRAHRSHAFAASRDEAMIRGALSVNASRPDAGTVEVRLRANGVGHAVPTGDLFRRIEVLAEAIGPEAQVITEDVRYLARRFGKGKGRDGRPIKVMAEDARVPASGEVTVRLSLGAQAAGLPIAWRVAYQRVAHPIDGGAAAVVAGEIEIARGILRAAPASVTGSAKGAVDAPRRPR